MEDTSAYREMLRMSHEDFLTIFSFIKREISHHQVAGGNAVIEPKARLTLTLRFLATGETFAPWNFNLRYRGLQFPTL